MKRTLKLAVAVALMIGLAFTASAQSVVENNAPPETKATSKIIVALEATVPQAVAPYAKTMSMARVDPSSINGHPVAIGTFVPDSSTDSIADKMFVAFCFNAERVPEGVGLHLTYVIAAKIIKGDKQELIYSDPSAPRIKESKGTPVSTEIVPQK